MSCSISNLDYVSCCRQAKNGCAKVWNRAQNFVMGPKANGLKESYQVLEHSFRGNVGPDLCNECSGFQNVNKYLDFIIYGGHQCQYDSKTIRLPLSERQACVPLFSEETSDALIQVVLRLSFEILTGITNGVNRTIEW